MTLWSTELYESKVVEEITKLVRNPKNKTVKWKKKHSRKTNSVLVVN